MECLWMNRLATTCQSRNVANWKVQTYDRLGVPQEFALDALKPCPAAALRIRGRCWLQGGAQRLSRPVIRDYWQWLAGGRDSLIDFRKVSEVFRPDDVKEW